MRIRNELYQASVSLTGPAMDRLDKRWRELNLKSRSAFIAAGTDFFEGQPDDKILYWMAKVQEDMKRKRE